MACDTTVEAQKETSENIANNTENKKEKKMGSSLVLQKAPEFKMDAYDAKTGHYTVVNSEDYKGKWHVVCFYPADFTFVTDTKFSHKRFVETEPLLKGLKLTIGADTTGKVSRAFGVMIEDEGIALRGRFLINPDGVVVAQEVQAPSVGRNVNEFLRQVKAWKHATETGEVCPANWRPGKKTLPVNTDVEKMTGRVGDYITIEEILS